MTFIASTGMLIRRPIADVFEAFVDPAVTSKFWFTHGSARLEAGQRVRWDWAMYGASAEVEVVALDPPTRIVVHWPTRVEWRFTPRGEGATFVAVTDSGFTGTLEEAATQAIDSASGFSFVLAGAKAWLEQGRTLNLIADRHPDGWQEGG